MENINNLEKSRRSYVFHREVRQTPQGPQKEENFKIFLRENDNSRYYIIFEIPPEERNLDDFRIFQSFLKRNFGEDILSKNFDEVFTKLKQIAKPIENLND